MSILSMQRQRHLILMRRTISNQSQVITVYNTALLFGFVYSALSTHCTTDFAFRLRVASAPECVLENIYASAAEKLSSAPQLQLQ